MMTEQQPSPWQSGPRKVLLDISFVIGVILWMGGPVFTAWATENGHTGLAWAGVAMVLLGVVPALVILRAIPPPAQQDTEPSPQRVDTRKPYTLVSAQSVGLPSAGSRIFGEQDVYLSQNADYERDRQL